MSERTTEHQIYLLAPLPFSQEPWPVPPEFPQSMLEEMFKRGYTRIDPDVPKKKAKKETSNGTSQANGNRESDEAR